VIGAALAAAVATRLAVLRPVVVAALDVAAVAKAAAAASVPEWAAGAAARSALFRPRAGF
jgi:hypothetical protein